MYAVKVEPGRERPEVRRISTGFLPTYRVYTGSAEEKSVRSLVVSGYVFSLSITRNAEPVPNKEWEIIDKLSASAISMLDKSGKILSGPLTGLDRYVTKTGKDYVQLCVNLLGEARTYRLPCRIAEEPGVTGENEKGAPAMAVDNKELTEERIAAMLERAEKVGIHAAAGEFGIAWQTLAKFRRRAGGAGAGKPEPGLKAGSAKRGRPKVVKAVAQQLSEAELEAENAALRKQVEELTAKLEKVKNTLTDLLKS